MIAESIFLFQMILESEDMSQEAEKVAGHQIIIKRGMMDQKR